MAIVLGVFFLALALPVGVGTVFSELAIDRAINVAAAAILAAVGALLVAWGRRGPASS